MGIEFRGSDCEKFFVAETVHPRLGVPPGTEGVQVIAHGVDALNGFVICTPKAHKDIVVRLAGVAMENHCNFRSLRFVVGMMLQVERCGEAQADGGEVAFTDAHEGLAHRLVFSGVRVVCYDDVLNHLDEIGRDIPQNVSTHA